MTDQHAPTEHPSEPKPVGTTTGDWPSRRAGLRDDIAAALEAADYSGNMRRGDLADSVLPVLYREWPWLRAEAEELEAVLATVRELHQPIADDSGPSYCQTCTQEEQQPPPVGWWVPYPCPTVAALDEVGAGGVAPDLATARETNRRLNLRTQQLESELAAYRRAISTWEFTERGTYVPLRSITAMGKAAGVGYNGTRYEQHYERVERAEATVTRVEEAVASFDGRGVLAIGNVNLDIPTAGEVLDKVRAALDEPTGPQPDFTTPLAGRIEVRDPCPWCPPPAVIPRTLMDEHVATVHPEVREGGPGIPLPDAEAADVGTEFEQQRDRARETNRRLNLRTQQLESELAAYRRAVASWEVSDRGTYITHASLQAIGRAGGVDLLGSVRHLKHFERVEQAEAAVAGLAQAIRLTREYVGADLLPAAEGWAWYDALRRWAPTELPDTTPSCSPGTEETEPNNQPPYPGWGQLEARAFNAVLPTLRDCGERLPLSARRAVALAILAELGPELAALAAYENAITWHTNRLSCARVLDSSIQETERAEKAEAERDELHAALGLIRGQLHSAALSAIRGRGINIRELAARAEKAEDAVTRLVGLYEQWVKAGPPPLGMPMSRWWDRRLVELHDAIRTPAEQPRTTADNPAATEATGASDKPNAAWTPPPPGSDRDKLPDHLLALIADRMRPYLSTACETAAALEAVTSEHPDHADELQQWAGRGHASCRLTRKQDMDGCICGCHNGQPEQQL